MRNYQKYPLKKRVEKPPKEDLEQLYFVKNWTLVEISEYFKRTRQTIITWFHEYSIPKKDKSQILATRKRTNLKKFGYDNPFRDVERVKQGCIKKFGVDNIFKNKEYIKQALKNKYGVENPSQSKFIQNKKYITMETNHTYNTSQKEENAYNKLVEKFGKENVKRQYNSKEYPFACDFFVVPSKLYIECNYHWTHGMEGEKIFAPYNKDNIEHNKLLNKWKQKNTVYYNNAIQVWTKADPLKLETFQKNKLNYKIFYTTQDFDNWYKTI